MVERDNGVGKQAPIDAGKPDTGLRVLAILKDGQLWVRQGRIPDFFRRVHPHRQTPE